MPGAGTNPRFVWPATIDSTNKTLRYTDGSGTVDDDLGEGDHFWRGDGSLDLTYYVDKLLTEAAAATGSGLLYTVTLLSTGVLRIVSTATFTIEWSHANTTLVPSLFGFDAVDQVAVDEGGGVWAMESDFQVGNAWIPEQIYIDDSEEVPRYASTFTQLMSGRTRTQRWGSWTTREVLVDVLPPNKVFTAEESRTNEAFERFFDWLSQGRRFEFTRDWENTPAPDGTYVIVDPEWIQLWPATIPHGTIRRYNIAFPMLVYVA